MQMIKITESIEEVKEHAVCVSIVFDGDPQDLQEVCTDLRCRAEPKPLPAEHPADMQRQLDPNQFVRTAEVGKATADLPQIFLVKYNCSKCNYDQGPLVLSQTEDLKPESCPECQSLGPFTVKKKQCFPGGRQTDGALAPLRTSFLTSDVGEYSSECFPRSEYKTRFHHTSAFEMSDPEHWGTYFRTTPDNDQSDRLSKLESKEYQNPYTNLLSTTSTEAGTLCSPWQHAQYNSIFHPTPKAPKISHGPAHLYDLLLSYKITACLRVERNFNEITFAAKRLEVYCANDYPCVFVKIQDCENVFTEPERLCEIAMTYFVAIANKIAHSKNIPIELVIRESFGHNIPSVSKIITSFRINIGVTPKIYTEVLVQSLIELNDMFLDPLFNSTFRINLNAAQIQNHNEGVAIYNKHHKGTEKQRSVGLWSENECLLKVLNKVGNSNGNKVCSQIMKPRKNVDLLANYASEELDQPQPNFVNPLTKLLGQLSYSDKVVLNVPESDYKKVSMHAYSGEENHELKEDFVFWRIMHDVVLAFDVECGHELLEAIEAHKLFGLYKMLEKENLNFIRNSGYQEAQDGCGSDSDCEIQSNPTFYSRKVTVATGMRAINLAHFLSVYRLRQQGFTPQTDADKMYYETKNAVQTVRDIFTGLALDNSTQEHEGNAFIRYIDLNHCAAAGPEPLGLRDIMRKTSENDIVVLDYTSANTERIRAYVNKFIKKVHVIILVSSGLKHEQLGADMNTYGTIRIVAKDRGIIIELYSLLKNVLELTKEVLAKELHCIRKAYKNAGAVVTNAGIYKEMYRKLGSDETR